MSVVLTLEKIQVKILFTFTLKTAESAIFGFNYTYKFIRHGELIGNPDWVFCGKHVFSNNAIVDSPIHTLRDRLRYLKTRSNLNKVLTLTC